MRRNIRHRILNIASATLVSLLFATAAFGVDVISNGNFSSGTTGWTHTDIVGSTAMSSDGSAGNPSPSLKDLTGTGKKTPFEWHDYQNITTTINSTDDVFLSLWWQKISFASIAQDATDIEVRIVKPSSAEVTIWSETSTPPAPGTPITGTVSSLNVGSFFDEDGLYEIRLYANVQTGNNNSAQIQINWDNVVLDAQPVVANDPPVVTNIPNQSVPEGSTFATIALDNYVSDPDHTDAEMTWSYSGNTELTVNIVSRVATITIPDINWNGNETITFRATDPGSLWDEDPATFTVTAVNDPPIIALGATSVSVSPVDRIGSNTTVISTAFSDADVPGVGAFNVTFKIREPNNSTELTLVNAQPNGGGGLSISDDGGGNYTASYTYNPDDAQTLGLYDLYMEVTDGTDNAIDNYTDGDNADELEITEPANNAPTITAGATTVSVTPVNRYGSNTTTISTAFSDADAPGVGAFNVTFKIKDNVESETVLVNNLTNGTGGLTITDQGGGNYTASYVYNPDDAQTLGLYDLYMEVTDGTDNAIDGYTAGDNENQLEIDETLPNNAPTLTAGAVEPSVTPVIRTGANTTTLSATFSDVDDPGVGAFNVSFKIRYPNNSTEIFLATNQPHGSGGITIIDNGGGSYTASFVYNPNDAQQLGLYDLYFDVTDGTDNAVDGYASGDNTDELEIVDAPNSAPTVSLGATSVSPTSVNRLGGITTVISTSFSDADAPGVGAFNVTFKILEPNNITELTLVNNQPNGGGGLTITDDGGGDYTANYTYNPSDAQTVGAYDLYFEVSDGVDNVVDPYTSNVDELAIVEPPVLAFGATVATPIWVLRSGANTTVISADFTDADDPGVGAFNVTFQVRKPDNSTVETLVNNEVNGAGGLTIIDNGGGSYTASYTWDPPNNQTLGFYDLYCQVSDATGSSTDNFDEEDELEVVNAPPANPPTVTPGATAAAPASVNRIGTNATTISTVFTDIDQPGVGAFTVTFKVKDNVEAETILVNALTNGSGGLTITDGGGGSYTASYTWDPGDAQNTGTYDLYFEVGDGTGSAIDAYVDNSDMLTITSVAANNAPTVVASATGVSPASINRIGANTTVVSTQFSDVDQPGVGAFTVTFKVKDNVEAETVLVDNLANGAGGLTITDGGGGSYTATYSWDPGDAQTLGLYDLYFYVSDGTDNVTDPYTSNVDELEITEPAGNQAPTVTPGATVVSVSPVDRIGANTTVISTSFSDADIPGVGAFNVTFKIREQNDVTQLTLVNAQPNGGGGLTITDQGSGNYTASYTYNPDDAQTLGLYDLYFYVSDGTDNALDPYTSNVDELEITEPAGNQAPTVTSSATVVSVSPVNRVGTNSTIVSATFNDADQPGVNAFTVTLKLRYPNNVTELALVNSQTNGSGGLTVTDGGGGSYTASYSYDPSVSQTLGLYDLFFEVSDGTDNAIDGFANNLDELEIVDIAGNQTPTIIAGAANASVNPVNRFGSNNTTVQAVFTDNDQPGIGAFTVTFKIREPNNSTELVLASGLGHGAGGVTIVDNGLGNYVARYSYNPDDAQTLGFYDMYFEVSDGTDNAIDGYANNLDELEIVDVPSNLPPVLVAGGTSVAPGSIDRVGGATTTFSVQLGDSDEPGIGAFYITFKVRSPFNESVHIVADGLQHGQGGLSITDDGGGLYTASISWDPADNYALGYYDLYSDVYDGSDSDTDYFDDNADELLLTNGGENIPPVVPSDNVFASPAGVERIGANPTTLSATFSDGDSPGIGAFAVSFKLRDTNNVTEIVLANNVGNGTGGVTITDGGGGIYTASISWDPGDAQTLGYYDLYFHVTDGADTSYDRFENNLDELELYDAISNNSPTISGGATFPLPTSVNRIGTGFAMLKATFADVDEPGLGAFTVTFKVRDLASGEVTVVNAAKHGEQGVRVVNLGGGNYEAAVLWDPDVAEPTGGHDLYFSVTDNNNATAIDNYAANTDELNVTSAAILGDGHLLRRDNDSTTCGGPANACHNLPEHQEQGCRVCHTPHGTSNIYLVKETITTPSSGDMPVIFKTLGIGDPYNDPDPVKGDPTSGVMADSTDDVYTGVCEVCHTGTTHHRNDGTYGSADSAVHNDALDCTSCHPHTDGFAVSGGGESGGGSNCVCHSAIFNPMNTSTTSYHHQINSNNPDYASASRTCLMCHVDHDIFRPDLNTGFGTRAKNLRSAYNNSPVQGDATVLLNSDYQSTGSGGICLSCHVSTQTKSFTPPDGSTETAAISKTEFDAATGTHNYTVPSTFSSDASTFNGNCVKCHNDTMTKSYQSGTNKFSAHDNPYGRILNPFGTASPSDPLEENVCYACHSTTSNPNAGSNQDYFGVKAMSSTALRVENAFGLTYSHPTETYSGRHSADESASGLADGNRHAECGDCHSVHGAQQGTHDGSSSLASNALKGTWGVKPTSWPDPVVPSDNSNVFSAPASFTRVEDATLEEWMICLKCHSNYTTLPSGARNLAEEINPGYPSTHGITAFNQNSYCNTSTMQEPWASSGRTYCSDCHRSSNSSDPEGPHGSNNEHLLVASIVSNDQVGTPLCYVCHSEPVYWSSGASASRYTQHPSTKAAHQKPKGCFACHMWDYAWQSGLGVQTNEDMVGGFGKVFVHGQNKYHNYKDDNGDAGEFPGTGADAFVNGYIADMDYGGTSCWSDEDADGCSHGHNGTGY